MRYALIGCGLAGLKRAAALSPGALLWAVDPDPAARRRAGAPRAGASAAQALADPGVEAAIIAAPTPRLEALAAQALRAGRHELVEKPGATSARGLAALARQAARAGLCLKVGYNHRHHPGLRRAKALLDSGAIGEPLIARARYGHGGRPGYGSEWRARRPGGGELLDQGTHLIDLALWMLGPLKPAYARLPTLYWGCPVEDNAFLCLSGPKGRTAWLHASWTEWKNLFSFELAGRTGRIEVTGLGGSYGEESLTLDRMGAKLGPPRRRVWRFPGPDLSWARELAQFERALKAGPPYPRFAEQALSVLRAAAPRARRS